MFTPEDEILLSAYLDGELTGVEQQRVELLLSEDAGFRQLHDELRALRHRLESLPSHRLEPEFYQGVLAAAERQMVAPSDLRPPTSDLAVLAAAERELVAPAEEDAPYRSRSSYRDSADEPLRESRAQRWLRPLLWSGLSVAAALLLMLLSPQQQQPPKNLARHDAPAPAGNKEAGERGDGARDDRKPAEIKAPEMKPVVTIRAREGAPRERAVESNAGESDADNSEKKLGDAFRAMPARTNRSDAEKSGLQSDLNRDLVKDRAANEKSAEDRKSLDYGDKNVAPLAASGPAAPPAPASVAAPGAAPPPGQIAIDDENRRGASSSAAATPAPPKAEAPKTVGDGPTDERPMPAADSKAGHDAGALRDSALRDQVARSQSANGAAAGASGKSGADELREAKRALVQSRTAQAGEQHADAALAKGAAGAAAGHLEGHALGNGARPAALSFTVTTTPEVANGKRFDQLVADARAAQPGVPEPAVQIAQAERLDKLSQASEETTKAAARFADEQLPARQEAQGEVAAVHVASLTYAQLVELLAQMKERPDEFTLSAIPGALGEDVQRRVASHSEIAAAKKLRPSDLAKNKELAGPPREENLPTAGGIAAQKAKAPQGSAANDLTQAAAKVNQASEGEATHNAPAAEPLKSAFDKHQPAGPGPAATSPQKPGDAKADDTKSGQAGGAADGLIHVDFYFRVPAKP